MKNGAYVFQIHHIQRRQKALLWSKGLIYSRCRFGASFGWRCVRVDCLLTRQNHVLDSWGSADRGDFDVVIFF